MAQNPPAITLELTNGLKLTTGGLAHVPGDFIRLEHPNGRFKFWSHEEWEGDPIKTIAEIFREAAQIPKHTTLQMLQDAYFDGTSDMVYKLTEYATLEELWEMAQEAYPTLSREEILNTYCPGYPDESDEATLQRALIEYFLCTDQ